MNFTVSVQPNNQVIFGLNRQNKSIEFSKLEQLVDSLSKEVLIHRKLSSLTGLVTENVQCLTSCIKKLQDAKDHSTRDKIFGMLRAALYVGLIAAAFFGPIVVGLVGNAILPSLISHLGVGLSLSTIILFALGLTGSFVYGAYSFVEHHLERGRLRLFDFFFDDEWKIMILPITLPITFSLAPLGFIHDGFTRISFLENRVSKHTRLIKNNFDQITDFLKENGNEEKIVKFLDNSTISADKLKDLKDTLAFFSEFQAQ